MSTPDPTARIAAALATYREAKTGQAEAAARPHTESEKVLAAYNRKLVAAHELANVVAAEWSSVLARLAAADAVIAAVREAVPASEWHDEDGPILAYEDTRPLWRALAAYDALAGTGEG